VYFHSLFTSALDIGYWSASRLGRLTPGKDHQYLLHNKRLEGPQILSGGFGEEIDLMPLSGVEPQSVACTAHSLVTILTELFQLHGIMCSSVNCALRHNIIWVTRSKILGVLDM
jgi:hypothetical protein